MQVIRYSKLLNLIMAGISIITTIIWNLHPKRSRVKSKRIEVENKTDKNKS